MRFSKRGSRFLAMLLAIVMCFSMSSVAFAAETMVEGTGQENIMEDEAAVQPRSQILVDYGGNSLRGTNNEYPCPPKGAKLRLVINNAIRPNDTSAIKVEVTKNGGWWPSKTITIPKAQGAANYTLIESCNGETYTVKFTADNGYFVANIVW